MQKKNQKLGKYISAMLLIITPTKKAQKCILLFSGKIGVNIKEIGVKVEGQEMTVGLSTAGRT